MAVDAALAFLEEWESDYAYYTDEELAESPKERMARLKAKAVPKGHCRKCGKHIGRGVAFHEKACK